MAPRKRRARRSKAADAAPAVSEEPEPPPAEEPAQAAPVPEEQYVSWAHQEAVADQTSLQAAGVDVESELTRPEALRRRRVPPQEAEQHVSRARQAVADQKSLQAAGADVESKPARPEPTRHASVAAAFDQLIDLLDRNNDRIAYLLILLLIALHYCTTDGIVGVYTTVTTIWWVEKILAKTQLFVIGALAREVPRFIKRVLRDASARTNFEKCTRSFPRFVSLEPSTDASLPCRWFRRSGQRQPQFSS